MIIGGLAAFALGVTNFLFPVMADIHAVIGSTTDIICAIGSIGGLVFAWLGFRKRKRKKGPKNPNLP